MSKVVTYAGSLNKGVSKDPVKAGKILLFYLLAIVLIFALFKFLRGLGKAGELLSDAGPSTESEKLETITKPSYQTGLLFLGDQIGAQLIGKSQFKTISNYFAAKKLTWSTINAAADAIYKAKIPGYISETEVYNAIGSMPSKAAVSLLALSFNQKYQNTFGVGKLNEFLGKYLKLSEMNTLTKIIDKKPDL